MAHLTKEQYNRRNENAASRNCDNEQIAIQNGLSEVQAELISKLCSLRHNTHCNIDRYIKGNGGDYSFRNECAKLANDFADNGLELPSYKIDCEEGLLIDDIYMLIEIGECPHDCESNEYQEVYEDLYSKYEELNKDIETYLKGIDEQYGTSFCPTGALRIM